MIKQLYKNKKGFTLIEILVVIGIIAILAAIVLIAINPARQFAQGRNSQRTSNVNALLNAVGQYQADNKGLLDCFETAGLDATPKIIASTGGLDVRSCIVSNYMPELPVDPRTGTAWDGSTYNTGYQMFTATSSRITVRAPGTETPPATAVIEVTR